MHDDDEIDRLYAHRDDPPPTWLGCTLIIMILLVIGFIVLLYWTTRN